MKRPQVRPDRILHAIAGRHRKDLFITEVKDGPTILSQHHRIDALAIRRSWAHPCITGYEVKVDRSDFQQDTKWPGYKNMCHLLYFACPAGLIQPEELPEDIGLVWYNPEKQTIFTKRKAVFRDIDIPWEMLYYIVICRTDSDRHPFFSGRREFLEAWVRDKEERKALGFWVKNKMAERIEELEDTVQELRYELQRRDRAVAEIARVQEIMRRVGLNTGYYWLEELEEALQSGFSPHLLNSLETIEREVRRMKKLSGLMEERKENEVETGDSRHSA